MKNLNPFSAEIKRKLAPKHSNNTRMAGAQGGWDS